VQTKEHPAAPVANVSHRKVAIPADDPVQDSLGYRLKNKVLGPPLSTDRLEHETLGKPTALAVFASDNLSSSAYATEEILRVLIPYIGLAAFTLVTPITIALLVVLFFLILSYRQTIKAYPSAGGAYIVTRDNFGLMPAQVAGVALLTDYVLTVAVSVAAGSDALASTFTWLQPYTLPIALFFVGVITLGNLRGTKESGRLFAVPTYFFIASMMLMIVVGAVRFALGTLPVGPTNLEGMEPLGTHEGGGLLMGATAFIVLKAFGSGGAAVTGVEAISNGVPAFKPPAWKNARQTLVIMGALLGVMFFGLSALAAKVHAMPYDDGVPSVISQVGKIVYGTTPVGHLLFYFLQVGTILILVLAANTSFADFPRLASFHAGDNFMPRQFMVRGHRLVFSNGIIFLALAACGALLATDGRVSRLIPLYAIGVFTSFTLSQSGMAKHHWTKREEGWRSGILINSIGALLSLVVLVIVSVVKFQQGAWFIIILVPIMVAGLVRLNKAYETEEEELKRDAKTAAEAPTLTRHAVIVFVDNLDAATARAMQYARTLTPDQLQAVHFDLDPWKTGILVDSWAELGFTRFPLDVVECTDRQIARAAFALVSPLTAAGDTEVTILIPRREYTKRWHRLLHDRSSNSLVTALADIPHCNVTVVPYHLGTRSIATDVDEVDPISTNGHGERPTRLGPKTAELPDAVFPAERTLISELVPRQQITVAGRVRAMRVQPWGGNPSLECSLSDQTGGITLVFTGRRSVPGIRLGTIMTATGVVGDHHGMRAILNPAYTLVQTPAEPSDPSKH
jgi:amino acid transporter